MLKSLAYMVKHSSNQGLSMLKQGDGPTLGGIPHPHVVVHTEAFPASWTFDGGIGAPWQKQPGEG